MNTVYLLSHTSSNATADEDRLIGVFVQEESASVAMHALTSANGFREHPTGFTIDGYVVDEDNWTEGFAVDERRYPRQESDGNVDCVSIDANSTVFVLEHRRVYGMHDGVCLIGVYSTERHARDAVQRQRTKPGFRSHVNGFVIYGFELNTLHWRDGFEPRDVALHRLLSFTAPSI